MKGREILLIAVMTTLVVIVVPLVSQKAYAADTGYIELLIPAESREVETGGGETPFVPMEPAVLGNHTGHIERLVPAETQETETGGGEIPFVPMEPVVLGNDAGFIERLLPAESQEAETGGGETSAAESQEVERGGGFDLKDWE